ncbi:hypothetical protein GIB67_009171 [Kingdonia uniflora]|uniref:non-specific serine/threonine protein kinase n=1 Tax=Kingdonia uniflora TaxID=39325 RepID=A0A7J7N2K1_9MAGN|nr:hypothetical protein GIB67_009171 [Kingdonia uniflora]
MEKYEDRGVLGKGNFGMAKLMQNKVTKEYVAVKLLNRGKKIDNNVEREILIHRSCRHPNITQFKEASFCFFCVFMMIIALDSNHLAIVMEYASGGELGKKSVTKAMFECATKEAKEVLKIAEKESRRVGHNHIGTEQILLGLIGESNGIAAKVFKTLGINLENVRIEVKIITGEGDGFLGAHELPYTPPAQQVLQHSLEEARKRGENLFGSEHLLLGLLREGEGVAAQVLKNLDADPNNVRTQASLYIPEKVGGEPGKSDPTGDENSDNRTNKGKADPVEDDESSNAADEKSGESGKSSTSVKDVKPNNVTDKDKSESNNIKYDEDQARKYFQQLISGIHYLHSMQICHRDLKLENTLLDLSGPTPQLKICDFGYAKSSLLHSRPKSTVGTAAYIAPEVFSQRQYNGKLADIWSCGVALYVMVVGKYPFNDPKDVMNYRKTMERIMAVDYEIPKEHFSKDGIDLLEKIFIVNPSKRITIREIKKHPFFTRDLPDDLSEENQAVYYVRDDPRYPLQSVDDIKNILEEAKTDPHISDL